MRVDRTAPSPTEPATAAPRRLELAVLAIVALVALVHLPFPFWADQSFSTVVAKALREGDVLYRDIWDVKQPGSHIFYVIAGSLFGFREVGVHVLEALYFIAFAIVLQRTLRGRFEHAWVAATTPLFVIVAYWAAATYAELTQLEALVGFPLYVACWGVSDTSDRALSSRRMVVTGLAGAAVAYFKLLYLPIVLVVWAIAMVDVGRRDGARDMLRRFRGLVVAFLVPAAIAFVYFAAYGLLYEVFWTYVVYPPKKRSLDIDDPERLETSLRYLARNFSWTLPPIAFALWRRAWRDRLVVALLIWLGLGTALVFVQLQFPYQFQLLIVPIGLLAAFGFDRLVTAWQASRSAVVVMLVAAAIVLAVIPARALAGKGLTWARDDFGLTAEGREHFHTKYNPYYPVAKESVAFLREPGSAPGPIHVIGDYVLQYQSGRDMAIPINGNTVEELDSRLWRKAREQLAEERPPYIYVSDVGDELMRERSPETRDFLADEYCRLRRVTDGTWYANRALGACD